MKLKAKHPARNVVASLETYWDKPGQAITAIAERLEQFGITLPEVVSFNDTLPQATYRYLLVMDGEELNSLLIFQWYKLESGRYEITTYLS